MEALKRARQLLEQFDDLIVSDSPGAYTMADGKASFNVVFRIKGVEVIHAHLDPGTHIKAHTHVQSEFYLVYEGDAALETPTGITDLVKRPNSSVLPSISHSLSSENGCKLLIARIPSIKEAAYTHG